MTLDEVQREPGVLAAVKRAIDRDRKSGRFLLIGSANLLLMHRVSELLAGRASYLTLWPMTRREQRGEGHAGRWDELLAAHDDEWLDLLAAGGAPPEDWRALARRLSDACARTRRRQGAHDLVRRLRRYLPRTRPAGAGLDQRAARLPPADARRLLPIEVKASARPRLADAAHLGSFRAEYGKKARAALLLHTGGRLEWLAPDVLAAPGLPVFRRSDAPPASATNHNRGPCTSHAGGITMDRTLTLVIWMAILTWLTLLAASLIRVKGWTFPGTMLAFGNREDLPEPTPLAGRAERTARNTLESFVLFAAIALVAHAAGAPSPKVAAGAELFFWARVAYVPVYYAGIRFLRTAVWVAGIVGLAMMLLALP